MKSVIDGNTQAAFKEDLFEEIYDQQWKIDDLEYEVENWKFCTYGLWIVVAILTGILIHMGIK
jgi:hypothetical protein